jgi:hypothetical protein
MSEVQARSYGWNGAILKALDDDCGLGNHALGLVHKQLPTLRLDADKIRTVALT